MFWCYQNLPWGIFWRFAFRCSRHPAESIRLAFERSCAAGRQRSYRRIACRKDGATSTGPVWTSFFQEKHLVLSKPTIGKNLVLSKAPQKKISRHFVGEFTEASCGFWRRFPKSNVPDSTKNGHFFFEGLWVLIAPNVLVLSKPTMGNFLALRFPVQPASGREHPPCFRAILCSRPPEKLSPHCVPQRRRDLDRSGLDIFFSGKTFGAIKTYHWKKFGAIKSPPEENLETFFWGIYRKTVRVVLAEAK